MTFNDLFNNPPKSYVDLTKITPIAEAVGECVIAGVVTHILTTPKMLSVEIKDSTGVMNILFFRYSQYHQYSFRYGRAVTLHGVVADNNKMIHPQILKPEDLGRIKPVYGRGVSARQVEKAIQGITDDNDPVPQEIQGERGLPDMKETMRMLHRPNRMQETEIAFWRLAYTELYAEMEAAAGHHEIVGEGLDVDAKAIAEFTDKFPFKLTNGQQQSINEIVGDLKSPKPMRRILIGDVGAGKTEVAITAAYATMKAGYRVLYLCPTEILAIQTYHRVAKAMAGEAYVALYTADEKVKKATPDILVGTHALLFNGWQYHKIGLVICDEQHKFGVDQRSRILPSPEINLLEMTATPIPRSYALFMQSIMDVSILEDMPFKKSVETELITDKDDYQKALNVIRAEVGKGNQALIIYPSVESEKANMRAATKAVEYWETVYGDKVALLHGKMKGKESILKRFSMGETSILVSTTAAEVGIDVPKLTVCVVANAERFSIVQLHQIRGRVGRRGDKSHFFLICKNETSVERLQCLEKFIDGFDVAEADMNKRGVGTLNGDAQSGHYFRYFSLTDTEIATAAKIDHQDMIERRLSAVGRTQ